MAILSLIASLRGSRHPRARFAPAARPLGCEGLGWHFWGRKAVRHASRPLRAGVRTRAPTPWLPAPFRGLRARGRGLPGMGAGTGTGGGAGIPSDPHCQISEISNSIGLCVVCTRGGASSSSPSLRPSSLPSQPVHLGPCLVLGYQPLENDLVTLRLASVVRAPGEAVLFAFSGVAC